MKGMNVHKIRLAATLCKVCGAPIITIDPATLPDFLKEVYREYGGYCQECTTPQMFADMEKATDEAIAAEAVKNGETPPDDYRHDN